MSIDVPVRVTTVYFFRVKQRSNAIQHEHGHFWWKKNKTPKCCANIYGNCIYDFKYIISISYMKQCNRERSWSEGCIVLTKKRRSNKHLTYLHTKWKFAHILWFCFIAMHRIYSDNDNRWNRSKFDTLMHIAIPLKRKWMANQLEIQTFQNVLVLVFRNIFAFSVSVCVCVSLSLTCVVRFIDVFRS